MNILFVNPETPDTNWSFKHLTMMFSRKRERKASSPPLALLTASAMFPGEWSCRLVDMNIEKLKDRQLRWADYVYIDADAVQADSADQVIDRAHGANRRVIAAGQHFTDNYERYNHVDHLLLNEMEITLRDFLKGFDANWPWRVYRTNEYADIRQSPVPDYSIARIKKYNSLSIQYSRGCPADCKNCDKSIVHGNELRTKSVAQVLLELDNIYDKGYRGSISFQDGNFMCNTEKLKNELLPSLTKWNVIHKNPFTFNTEVTLDISDDKELLEMMSKAGFAKIFIGMESSDDELLYDCDKRFVINRNMILSINNIRNHGLEVFAG